MNTNEFVKESKKEEYTTYAYDLWKKAIITLLRCILTERRIQSNILGEKKRTQKDKSY